MKKMLALVLNWLGNRLREPSTYFGAIVAVLGWIGVEASNARVESIAGAVTVLVGVALSIIKERNAPDNKRNLPQVGIPDPSIPDAAVVRDDADDKVQAVDLPHGIGGAREKWRHRNEQ